MKAHLNKRLGRWQVCLPGGRRDYRYRIVMAEHLGRPLATDEHVHHLNGDPTDDRIENLQVMSAKEHAMFHTQDRVAAQRAIRGYAWGPAGLASCVDCGTTERPHTACGECSRCYYRNLQRKKGGHAPRKPAVVVTRDCEQCGDSFSRTRKDGGGKTRFCSKSCASRTTQLARWAKQKAAA